MSSILNVISELEELYSIEAGEFKMKSNENYNESLYRFLNHILRSSKSIISFKQELESRERRIEELVTLLHQSKQVEKIRDATIINLNSKIQQIDHENTREDLQRSESRHGTQ
mgnify:CR=1 FL=1